MKMMLILGLGYSAQVLAGRLVAQGWQVTGTTRNAGRAAELAAMGITPILLPADLSGALRDASHILISAAPDAGGDPFLQSGFDWPGLRPEWVGYLSTTAVYGDHGGAWVDEDSPLNPATPRASQRILAESQWLATGLPVHVFRLAGIYGPGRGPFEKVRDGTARRIIKPGQVFSRIHVEDIATVLQASIAQPNPGRAYNLCDDEPADPAEIIGEAARLLDLPPPPAVPFEQAQLSPMARSFYMDNKRVRNDRIKAELGVTLAHPGFRQGLRAILAAGG
jgi:nucleoside-diphosphate-sugar epimerase